MQDGAKGMRMTLGKSYKFHSDDKLIFVQGKRDVPRNKFSEVNSAEFYKMEKSIHGDDIKFSSMVKH